MADNLPNLMTHSEPQGAELGAITLSPFALMVCRVPPTGLQAPQEHWFLLISVALESRLGLTHSRWAVNIY